MADETPSFGDSDQESVPLDDGHGNRPSNTPTITCLSCQTELELSASFCTGCGKSRTEALTPTAPPSVPVGEQIAETFQLQLQSFGESLKRGATSGKASTILMVKVTILKVKIKKIQLGNFARGHKWLVVFGCLVLVMVLAGAIAREVVQAQIYAKASPKNVAEAYAQAVVSRDPKVLSNPELFPRTDANLPIVDSKLINSGSITKKTVPVVELNWKTGSAKAEFNVKWGSSGLSSTVQMSPRESSKWVIFKDRSWVVSTPAPVLKVSVTAPSAAKVVINGVSVGSSSSAAVSKLKDGVVTLPTSWKLSVGQVGFYGSGTDGTGGQDPVFNATLRATAYESVPSTVTVNASTRARAALRKCVRKDCDDIPYISDTDLGIGDSFYSIFSDYTETENNYTINSCISSSPTVSVSRPTLATVGVTCDVSLQRTKTYVTLYTYIPNDYNYEFGNASFTMEYVVTYQGNQRSARSIRTRFSSAQVTSP